MNRDITCSNDFCHDAQWMNSTMGEFTVDRPPLKDTVSIPVGGYAVVRVYTDNPGYWMAHCHQTEHLHEGSIKCCLPVNLMQCNCNANEMKV